VKRGSLGARFGYPWAAVVVWVHRVKQAEDRLPAGALWQDHGLVFPSAVGTPLDPSHVRRAFRKICKADGIGTTWSPPELPHTFVSIMSEQSVPVEEIARLVGHSTTATTEAVYGRELRPVIGTVRRLWTPSSIGGGAPWLASTVGQDPALQVCQLVASVSDQVFSARQPDKTTTCGTTAAEQRRRTSRPLFMEWFGDALMADMEMIMRHLGTNNTIPRSAT